MAGKEERLIAKELRERGDDELRSLLGSKQEELYRKRFNHVLRQLRETHELRALRRDIAKIHTVLRERRKTGQQIQEQG